ncbi:MAG TPA: NADPH:quinone oxidoreductase family protein [Rhodocyclaceae bacterium]|nr:NADPH:quinone oxidoreductase family protein [Rhodocyclaceae bacterium]
MKAVLCRQWGPPTALVIEDSPPPVAGPGEVVVAVKAAGVNFPDLLIIDNKYQFKPELPFTPGGEFAGTVVAVGDGVRRCKPGDQVVAFSTWGAFAEQAKVPETAVMPIVPGMDYAVAAGFLITYGTAYYALHDRGALQPGETLVVLGAAGGVGLAAVEIGKALGARVIACASSSEKLATCRAHGADETVNYADENLRDRLKVLCGKSGADVVLDPVGGGYSEAALRALGWKGRHLVVGFAAGDIPRMPLNLILVKGCAVLGVAWGEFAAREPSAFAEGLEALGRLFQAGKLRPHIFARYPLERVADAMQELATRRVQGKVILELG